MDDNASRAQLPWPKIQRLAADRELGSPLRTYQPIRVTKSYGWTLGIVMVILAVPFVAIGMSNLEEEPGFGVLCIVLTIGTFGGMALLAYGGTRKTRSEEGSALHLFNKGLIVAESDRLSAFDWDTADVYHHSRTVNSARADYTYTLVDENGFAMTIGIGNDALWATSIGVDEIVRGPQFAQPEQWGPEIENGIVHHQVPAAAEELNAGGTIAFGKFELDREGISQGRKSVSWSQVQAVSVYNGQVSVEARGTSGLRDTVSQVRNFQVFYVLTKRLSGV